MDLDLFLDLGPGLGCLVLDLLALVLRATGLERVEFPVESESFNGAAEAAGAGPGTTGAGAGARAGGSGPGAGAAAAGAGPK